MGISPTQLIIVLVIILLLFGTKKLRNIGSDLGGAVKGFKKAVRDGDKNAEDAPDSDKITDTDDARVIDSTASVNSEKNQEK